MSTHGYTMAAGFPSLPSGTASALRAELAKAARDGGTVEYWGVQVVYDPPRRRLLRRDDGVRTATVRTKSGREFRVTEDLNDRTLAAESGHGIQGRVPVRPEPTMLAWGDVIAAALHHR